VYRWIDHTAELELAIEAPTEQAVFAEALAAFAELVGDGGGADPVRHEIELQGDGLEGLLADWLDELVYLADVDAFVPEELTKMNLDGERLRATVRGHRGQPRPIVKAITRHRLAFEPDSQSSWRARVVLDV
jgi:SHS2 domain-containing protein